MKPNHHPQDVCAAGMAQPRRGAADHAEMPLPGTTRRASLRAGWRLGLAGMAAATMPAWLHASNAASLVSAVSAVGAHAADQALNRGAAASGQAQPVRLISMGSGLTEVVYRLGAEHLLVATDTTSTHPEAAQHTPKVGYLRQLSAEGILALRPTHVLATSEAGPPVVLDQLRAAGVALHVVPATHSWDEVRRKVNAVGLLPGLAQPAKQLLAELDAQWAAAQRQVAAHTGRKPRVLFVLAHAQSPSVSGEGTAADALIRCIGAENAVSGFKGYRAMTAEGLAQAAPDWILTTTQGLAAQGGADKFWGRPELALTPAFARKQLVAMDALEMIGFGPRLPATVQTLHQRVVRA